MENTMEKRLPTPPFTRDTAILKVQAAEDAWNTKNPLQVSKAYTPDSVWRNRDIFLQGRDSIVEFLSDKWNREQDYKLKKELWCFDNSHRIAVKFFYEWHNGEGQWFRSYGNELWEFNDLGLMARREASINDLMIEESERLLK